MPGPRVVGMLMIRPIGFMGGALAFALAHSVETARWHEWFQGEFDPWFLNSGRAILFTLGCMSVAGVLVAALNRTARAVRGVTVAAGGCFAMVCVLFFTGTGPGNLFPIVLVVGGTLLLVGSASGAWTGRELRRALRRT